jgi:hypothetical protein
MKISQGLKDEIERQYLFNKLNNTSRKVNYGDFKLYGYYIFSSASYIIEETLEEFTKRYIWFMNEEARKNRSFLNKGVYEPKTKRKSKIKLKFLQKS